MSFPETPPAPRVPAHAAPGPHNTAHHLRSVPAPGFAAYTDNPRPACMPCRWSGIFWWSPSTAGFLCNILRRPFYSLGAPLYLNGWTGALKTPSLFPGTGRSGPL